MTRTMAPPTSLTSASHSPSSSGSGRPRLRLSDDLVTAASHQLTDRDRYICNLLSEHRVLTTNQVAEVAFDSPISARHRLAILYGLRVLDRFRPFRRVGTAPNHWVLDAIGAMTVAAERGVESEELHWRRDHALGLASSRQLAHRVGVNGFFCSPARRRQKESRCRTQSLVAGTALHRKLGRGRPTRRLRGVVRGRNGGRLLLGVRPGHRDPRSPDGQVGGIQHPGLRDERPLLGAVLVHRRQERGRCPQSARRITRSPGHTAAEGEAPSAAVWLPIDTHAAGRRQLVDLPGSGQWRTRAR